jgi:hypothetical protein
MTHGKWLIPFKGRNDSISDQGFLWRHKSVYVMDSHRAATWCWLQHVDPDQSHSLLHIDQHYDCGSSRIEEVNCLPGLRHLSIDQYLALDCSPDDGLGGRFPVFRWDNYLSIYLARYRGSIRQLRMCTHDQGAKPEQDSTPGDIWNIPQQIDDWLDPTDGPWILNLDLDYFFWWVPDGRPGLMVSDEYLTVSFEKIRQKIEDQTIAVTTIALTPQRSLTGGWAPAERLAKFILGILGLDFELPHQSEPGVVPR